MAGVLEVIVRLLGYLIASISLPIIIIRCLMGYLKGIRTKDRTPPRCLTDPAYGTHHYVSVSKDVKLHYVSAGDKSKPLMLFVHGFPEFWYSWRHQIKEFSKDYWTVAVDLRGYGESTKPFPLGAYKVNCIKQDLKELIKLLGPKKVILVGHDWGGIICWKLIAEEPELVDCYICLNIPHPVAFLKAGIKQYIKSWYVAWFQVPFIPEFALSMLDANVFNKFFLNPSKQWTHNKVSEEDIEAFKYTFGQEGAWTPALNYYRANLDFESHQRIKPITVPVFMIWGDQDVALHVNGAKLSGDEVKDFKLHIIEGANHFVQQDAPDLVNKAMRDYLKSNGN